MLEKKRQDLLASNDPAEQHKGRSMVTAASLFDKYDGERYLASTVSLGETASHSQSTPDSAPHQEVLEKALGQGEQDEIQSVDMAATLQPFLEEQEKTAGTMKRPRGRPSSKQGLASSKAVWLWLPLTFKEVPKKGDWDVRRLKESTYFFS